MPQLPFPITARDIQDLVRQTSQLLDEMYTDRLGGALVGDVFYVGDDDILAIILADAGGLKKTGGELAILNKTTGGLTSTADGEAIKVKAGGGLQTDVDGLSLLTTSYAFRTIDCPAGTDPVAETAGDTLTLTASNGISITGTAGTDTVDIAIDATSSPTVVGATAVNDFTLTCGDNKTLVLAKVVYNDANVGSLVLQTGGTLPGIVEILDNDGDATGIYTRGFAVGEQGSGVIEVPHDYKEGTNLIFHIHWGIQGAPAGGTDNVQWQLTYSVSRDANTFPDSTAATAVQVAVTTQYQWVRTDLATITGATGGVDGGNIKIGDQVNFTLVRIAATADEYGGEALMATLGFHYQCDTAGSRTISAK
jgi:hypothetical protein